MTLEFTDGFNIQPQTGGTTINNQDKTITENGEYTADTGYTGLGTVTVNVSGGGGDTASKFGMTIENLIGNVDENGALHAPATPANAVFTGVKKRYSYWDSPDGYPEKFTDNVHISGQNIQSASFPDLVNANDGDLIGLFAGNESFLSLDLSNLISVTADDFFSSLCSGSSNLISVDLSNLEYATGESCFMEAFKNCYELTTISFPKLKEIGKTGMSGSGYGVFSNTFYGDYNLTTLEFPELTKLYSASLGYMPQAAAFYGNNNIKKLYFPKLTSILNSDGADATYVFTNCYQLTEIHFGAANQAAIEANAGYSTLWDRGAGRATVYFDL